MTASRWLEAFAHACPLSIFWCVWIISTSSLWHIHQYVLSPVDIMTGIHTPHIEPTNLSWFRFSRDDAPAIDPDTLLCRASSRASFDYLIFCFVCVRGDYTKHCKSNWRLKINTPCLQCITPSAALMRASLSNSRRCEESRRVVLPLKERSRDWIPVKPQVTAARSLRNTHKYLKLKRPRQKKAPMRPWMHNESAVKLKRSQHFLRVMQLEIHH